MQRLQHKFHELHKDKISDNVILKVEGGLEYKARYDKINGRLINLEKFLKDMHVEWFNPVILTYLGNSCFMVNVFMPSGIEQKHDSKCGVFLKKLKKLSLSKIPDISKETTIWKDRLIASHRAMAISRMNLYSYMRNPLIMKLEQKHISADGVYVVSTFLFSISK